MTFSEWLKQNEDAITRRWLQAALSAYHQEGSAAFQRQKDPFANPVGHRLRAGTGEIFEALLEGMDGARIRQHLQEILRIRAVQELSASRAVGFIFDLKDAVRAEMNGPTGHARFAPDLAVFDARIDQIALVAFDVYTQCRERLCELRINEVKRQVSWAVGRANARGPEPDASPSDRGDPTASGQIDLQQEGV